MFAHGRLQRLKATEIFLWQQPNEISQVWNQKNLQIYRSELDNWSHKFTDTSSQAPEGSKEQHLETSECQQHREGALEIAK